MILKRATKNTKIHYLGNQPEEPFNNPMLAGNFLKKHNVFIQTVVLVTVLWSVAFYNYQSQKELLLTQVKLDSDDIASSFKSSINRFNEIKTTMSLKKLVNDISLSLEIFEFRYLDKNGIVVSSMFQKEIGKKFTRPSLSHVLADPTKGGEFYYEVRDYVEVMAISYPLRKEGTLIGVIDLSVDISDHVYHGSKAVEFHKSHRQNDIRNLLKAIEGSVSNSLDIYKTTDLTKFLTAYIEGAKNVLEVAIVDNEGHILVSSNPEEVGHEVVISEYIEGVAKLSEKDGKPVFRIIIDKVPYEGHTGRLMLLIDGKSYVENEDKLHITAVVTSVITVFFAVLIIYSMYRINIERAKRENTRLELMVKERTAEIERISKTDQLTQLLNRGGLEDQMLVEFKRAHRYERHLALLILDLDLFKQVNDNYGHLCGDEVLRETAKRIKSSLRNADSVGRYGGEEIVVLLPETPLKDALVVAEKLRQVISSAPVTCNEHEISVTTSIGLSVLKSGVHDNYEQLLQEADEALYYSKDHGRNQTTTF